MFYCGGGILPDYANYGKRLLPTLWLEINFDHVTVREAYFSLPTGVPTKLPVFLVEQVGVVKIVYREKYPEIGKAHVATRADAMRSSEQALVVDAWTLDGFAHRSQHLSLSFSVSVPLVVMASFTGAEIAFPHWTDRCA